MNSFVSRIGSVALGTSLTFGCGGEPMELEDSVDVLEQAHIGHNNPDMGNGVDKMAYRAQFVGADGFTWHKRNVIDTTADITGLTAWNRSKNANQVCHRKGGIYGSNNCMGIDCSGCKTASRLALDPGYMDLLQGQPYWNLLSDADITAKLTGHSVIKNHFSHPDQQNYNADDAYIVRFDLPLAARGLSSWTATVELDVDIPSETACKNLNSAAIPYVQMEAAYHACPLSDSRSLCGNGYIGNGANDVSRTWNVNTQTCTVSTYHRLFRSSINNLYVWYIQVTAQGGIGHMPAPVRVRLE